MVGGMFLLQERDPRRFASDEGFRFQLVRRFRSLSDANIGLHNVHTGSVHRAYRELPPRTLEQLGQLLIEGYKTFTNFILRLERREVERAQEAKMLLHGGFDSIEEVTT